MDIQRICQVHDDSGEIYLRNAVVLAYFVQRPVHEIVASVAALLDAYLGYIPANALKWVIPSSSSEQWKPWNPNALASIRKMIVPAAAKARDMTSFRIADSQGEATEFEFRFVGKPKSRKTPPASSLVQLVLPIETVQPPYVQGLVERVRQLSSMIDFSYGYCSPVLQYSELRLIDAYTAIRGLALRHPGYDVQDNMLAAWRLGACVRGARWITLLGTGQVAALGGFEVLSRALPSPATVEKLGDGVMIRASEQPETGDVNRRKDTPALQRLAQVLEPITRFGEENLIFTRFEEDEAFLSRWERRFLDRTEGRVQ